MFLLLFYLTLQRYVSTGRPNSYTYYTKKAAYHAYPTCYLSSLSLPLFAVLRFFSEFFEVCRYINSHYNSAIQVIAMYIVYRIFIDASGGILPMIVIILAASVSSSPPPPLSLLSSPPPFHTRSYERGHNY